MDIYVGQRIAERRDVNVKGRQRNWREKFKKRCLDAIKKQRHAAMDNRRGLSLSEDTVMDQSVQDVMHTEFERLAQTQCFMDGPPQHTSVSSEFSEAQPDLDEMIDEDDTGDVPLTPTDQELLLDMWEEIKQEIMFEEAALLIQEEEDEEQANDLAHEHNELNDAALDVHSSSNVTCPVCQRERLHMKLCIIHCRCGFQLNTQDDGLTLPVFGRLIESVLDRHASQDCPEVLSFHLSESSFGIKTAPLLMAQCRACGFMDTV